MAPNTKQLNLIVQHLSAVDLGVDKQVFAPLTQGSTSSEAFGKECIDYWDWSHEPDDSDKYWDWGSNPKEEVVSSSRIIENLVKPSVKSSEVVYSGVDSNDYWDERSVKDCEVVTAQHENQDAVDAYWEWSFPHRHADVYANPLLSGEHAKTISSILEDERARHILSSDHVVENLRHSGSHMYWTSQVTTSHVDSSHYWNPHVAHIHAA